MKMEDFNAKKAREITDSNYDDELNEILLAIKQEAEVGKSVLHVYRNLKTRTVELLEARGFRVDVFPYATIMEDWLYFSIRW